MEIISSGIDVENNSLVQLFSPGDYREIYIVDLIIDAMKHVPPRK